ncbi:hypothetical protein BO71DRAFT_437644 [Aspergillus ellipticus CBS 707.79]|uniref:5-oxoprolinase n=1 Tax=Aspergillus ellipticus CBS 707.79 TaxID=1448320 RepID=A0A319DN75_9EURO|nr:hypothetical protein BO71DRAFT_437644 [Aspergillus ellipticus CBS 707.79]
MAASGIRISIDCGGTFTNIHASIAGRAEDIVLKLLSVNPQNYDNAPAEGIRRILEIASDTQIPPGQTIDLTAVSSIRMGTTVASNALLERRGERTALLVTRGFRDLLLMENQAQPDSFDMTISNQGALYEKIIEIDERVTLEGFTQDAEGHMVNFDSDPNLVTGVSREAVKILRKPYLAIVRQQIESLHDAGIRSIGICFMHSYTHPGHELVVAEIARNMGMSVTISSVSQPMIGMLPRSQWTTADAYLTPITQRFIEDFQKGFANQLEQQPSPQCDFMQSDGSVAQLREISGIKTILSGPAGGVFGYTLTCYDRLSGRPLLGVDIGGTSTDISRFAGQHEHVLKKVTAGTVLPMPQFDIKAVAVGGGSRLVWSNRMFKVGPSSAGADPGPACYRKGGPLTVTDANLFLGRLVPEYFSSTFGPNGNEALDLEATKRKFIDLCSDINNELAPGASSLSPEQVALGFLQAANESIHCPIRILTSIRGCESSSHNLVAFGGAGGQHACSLASLLGINRVILHRHSSVLSAYGMALTEIALGFQAPLSCIFETKNVTHIEEIVASLREKAYAKLQRTSLDAEDDVEFELYLYMNYQGCDTLILVRKPENGWHFEKKFIEQHQQEFGFTIPQPVMVDGVLLRAARKNNIADSADSPDQQIGCLKTFQVPSRDARVMSKDVYYEKTGWQLTPVYDLEALKIADQIRGPALIIDKTQTILVTQNAQATILKNHVIIDMDSSTALSKSQSVSSESSIFGSQPMRIAGLMSQRLHKTSISAMMKHLNLSCSISREHNRLTTNSEGAFPVGAYFCELLLTIIFSLAPHTIIDPGGIPTVTICISRLRNPNGTCSPNHGYYETIFGGTRASTEVHETDVLVRKPNTRTLDPELFERRYPCVVRAINFRRGSCQQGQLYGRDGFIKEIEFREPASVSILSDSGCQAPHVPHGTGAGAAGAAGAKFSLRKVTSRKEMNRAFQLDPKSSFQVEKNDRIIVEIPGADGWENNCGGREM